MKRILPYLILLGLFFSSCEMEEPAPESCEDTMVCVDDCLFALSDQLGQVAFINCFDSWGILFKVDPSQERFEITLVSDMPEEYQVEGKDIIFSATFFDNDIQPLFFDPSFFVNYKSELCDMRAQN